MPTRWKDMTPEQKRRRYEAQVKFRRLHPERRKAHVNNWNAKNPTYYRDWARKNYKLNPWRYVLRVAKGRAKKEGVPFGLQLVDIIVPTHCPVLGIPIVLYDGTNPLANNTPTLDRRVPSEGYTKDNVRVISFRANRLKNNGTLDEFRKIVAYMERG